MNVLLGLVLTAASLLGQVQIVQLSDGTAMAHYEDGTVVQRSVDGSKTTIYPDGARVYIDPQGRRVETLTSGEQMAYDAQGNFLFKRVVVVQPGRTDKHVLILDNGVEVRFSITGIDLLHPDGRRWSILYSGDRILFFPDGRQVIERTGGHFVMDTQGQAHDNGPLPADYWPLPPDGRILGPWSEERPNGSDTGHPN